MYIFSLPWIDTTPLWIYVLYVLKETKMNPGLESN